MLEIPERCNFKILRKPRLANVAKAPGTGNRFVSCRDTGKTKTALAKDAQSYDKAENSPTNNRTYYAKAKRRNIGKKPSGLAK
jgi:hypothetical protein